MATDGASGDRYLPPSTEFLFLLAHVEAALGTGCLEEDGDAEMQMAKASSYARALTARLQLWDGLSANLLEQYHTRIELLSHAVDLAKKSKLAECPEAELEAISMQGQSGSVHNEDDNSPLPDHATAFPPSISKADGSSRSNAPQSVQKLPWRAAGRSSVSRFSSTGNAARSNLESEMSDLAEGMKGAANTFLKTLQKDNKRLEDMKSAQQRSLDSVSSHAEKGKKMLRSGQLSFLCTMLLVGISVAIFCAMIPFIIFT
ncbi:unnamed protein product [Symbiodinium sp. KB8]|nr:unnamed protein product [Symbiodinium sp. KB8]